MIASAQFTNFKVLRSAKLPLERCTLIIGPNGSGKSTALQAIQAVGNPKVVKYKNIVSLPLNGQETGAVEIRLSWAGALAGAPQSKWRWEDGGGAQVEDAHSEALRHFVNGIRLFSLDAKRIAEDVPIQPDATLQPDGSGLAGVIDRLREESLERFGELNEELQNWFPEFDSVTPMTAGPGHKRLYLRTSSGHHKIEASKLAQGTLIGLALLTLAYLADPPTFIALEEPDRGLHPRLLRDVRDAMYRLAYPESVGDNRPAVQVVATTHSPIFLDMFREHPNEVVIAEKTESGAVFKRLIDHPHLTELLDNVSLGEIWYTGILGGVPVAS